MSDPFLYTSGPRDASILIIGEAWGHEENTEKKPFVGFSGQELRKMLGEAGILTSYCLFANLVDARPADNDFTNFLNTKSKSIPLFRGVYAKPELTAGHDKLLKLIDTLKPKLIIACGNWPLWALTNCTKQKTSTGYVVPTGIRSWRGSQLLTETINDRQYPLLPILHPASILRDWSWRATTVQDLRARGARFVNGKTTWTAPKRDAIYGVSAERILSQLTEFLRLCDKGPTELSIDLETYARKWIACIGLCDDKTELCIPFFSFTESGVIKNEFTLQEETSIITLLRSVLSHPNLRVIGQNFIYDYQWITSFFGIKLSVAFDTMLAHHLLYPGTPKSLDYLASMYCEHYVYWKDESEDWVGGKHLELWEYNCKDVRFTYEIAQELKKIIAKENLTDQYNFQLEQWQLAASMMDLGVRFNVEGKNAIRADLLAAAKEIETYLLLCVPENSRYTDSRRPWFTSPTLTADILYNQLGLKKVLHKKTKKPTTDAQALDTLGKQNLFLRPVFEKVAKYRSIQVFLSHFIDAKISSDNRIRCSYNVGGPETFRWSSSSNAFDEGTNLQNIPKGEE
jgi:uracil-DNA glycosylase family 4